MQEGWVSWDVTEVPVSSGGPGSESVLCRLRKRRLVHTDSESYYGHRDHADGPSYTPAPTEPVTGRGASPPGRGTTGTTLAPPPLPGHEALSDVPPRGRTLPEEGGGVRLTSVPGGVHSDTLKLDRPRRRHRPVRARTDGSRYPVDPLLYSNTCPVSPRVPFAHVRVPVGVTLPLRPSSGPSRPRSNPRGPRRPPSTSSSSDDTPECHGIRLHWTGRRATAGAGHYTFGSGSSSGRRTST